MPRTDHIVMPEDHMEQLYTAANPLVRFVHCQRLGAITRLLPETHGLAILDAGCGEGHLVEKMYARLPNNSYHGADITEVALENAKKRCPYAHFRSMNLTRLEYPDESFDIIVCSEVLEHIYEYRLGHWYLAVERHPAAIFFLRRIAFNRRNGRRGVAVEYLKEWVTL